MDTVRITTRPIHGALVGGLFLACVGFNVGFIKGGPGAGNTEVRVEPPVTDPQIRVSYAWDLPTAALGLVGEAILGATLGAAAIGVARRLFGAGAGGAAVILLGTVGGALVGYSVAGLVAGERVVVFTAHSHAHIRAATTVQANVTAVVVAILLGATIGSLTGRGVLGLFPGIGNPGDGVAAGAADR
jgi:hypothetical protein